MEQRLTRARRRLRQRGDPEGAAPERSLDRLDAVLRVVHLLFNEGYWSSDPATPIRTDLCRLAVGLSYSLVEAFPSEAEALGLQALLLFHDARREARLGRDGTPIPLPEQDRERWNPYHHLVRGTLLAEAGRVDEARACLLEARRVARNSAERSRIGERIARL